MEDQSIDLFRAHSEGKVALEGGYIVTSFFQDNSSYAKFEIMAYKAVKSLSPSEEGLTFQSDANKLFVLVEPADYAHRDVEPFARDGQHQVPHRFSELEQITAANMTRIMLSRLPVNVYSFFTVGKPTPLSSSLLFFNRPDALDSIAAYFERTLIARAGVPPFDAAEAARRIVAGLKRFTIWQEVVEREAVPPEPKKAPAVGWREDAWKAPPAAPAVAKAPSGMPAVKKPVVKEPAAPKTPAKPPARKLAAKTRGQEARGEETGGKKAARSKARREESARQKGCGSEGPRTQDRGQEGCREETGGEKACEESARSKARRKESARQKGCGEEGAGPEARLEEAGGKETRPQEEVDRAACSRDGCSAPGSAVWPVAGRHVSAPLDAA